MTTLLVLAWFVAQVYFAFRFATSRHEAGRWAVAFIFGLAVAVAFLGPQVEAFLR